MIPRPKEPDRNPAHQLIQPLDGPDKLRIATIIVYAIVTIMSREKIAKVQSGPSLMTIVVVRLWTVDTPIRILIS